MLTYCSYSIERTVSKLFNKLYINLCRGSYFFFCLAEKNKTFIPLCQSNQYFIKPIKLPEGSSVSGYCCKLQALLWQHCCWFRRAPFWLPPICGFSFINDGSGQLTWLVWASTVALMRGVERAAVRLALWLLNYL